MSFNLNKNEGASRPYKKTNFDLSKSDNDTISAAPKRPAYWLFALVALLVTGGAAWYLTGRNTSAKLPEGDTTLATRAATSAVVKDSAGLKSEPVGADVGVAASKPITAASFKAGSVKPGVAAGVLAGIQEKIKAGGDRKVSVFGYASSEGSQELNQRISQGRADAYKRLLVKAGVAEGRITALGRGVNNPVAPNDTEAGRRKNRRVEILY
ncbi:OmpA family protein [Mucilaginibacter sp. AK015]|uniref:OmpA family protein n=1 Tax=Mucilaginibacter sp. AK015 TaxID=2723072 RepID=UPI00161D817B|nr:OmpA family protein [Mucilaginibacter sp. AK015]MBB5395070.1 flagellar motor protein MotB [Mucilaginibacter sp. AK015]